MKNTKRGASAHPITSENRDDRHRDGKGRFGASVLPASDDRGHSINIQFWAPPDVGRLVDELLTDARVKGLYPWRTKGDVLRWLLLSGLDHLETAREEFQPIVAKIKLEEHVRRNRDLGKWADKLYTDICTTIDRQSNMDREAATQLFQAFLVQLHECERSPERDRVIQLLRVRYPLLLKGLPNARLDSETTQYIPLARKMDESWKPRKRKAWSPVLEWKKAAKKEKKVKSAPKPRAKKRR